MQRRHRRFALGAVILVLGMGCGCVKREVHGQQSVYKMEGWMAPATGLGGILALPIGWVALRKGQQRLGIGLMIVGPLLAILLAPSMFLDKTIVDADHFESSFGIWFSPTRKSIQFKDVRSIELVSKERRTRRGKRKDYSLSIQKTSGATESVPLGTILMEAAPEIILRAQARGIPVSDLTS